MPVHRSFSHICRAKHFEDLENSCPMVALPSDAARGGKSSKRAFQTGFKAMVSILERSLVENRQSRRVLSPATAALCVGGMVVARALADRTMADELREACMAVALQLGGWDKPDHPNKRKPGVSRHATTSSQTHAGNAKN